jgi:hypothetical protein
LPSTRVTRPIEAHPPETVTDFTAPLDSREQML